MSIITIFIISVAGISIVIGLLAGRKKSKTIENFFVAGRSLSFLTVALALLAQAIDGNATLGNTGLAHDFGFWAGAALPIGLALSLFLLGKWFAPQLQRMKLLTLVDVFERKYNHKIALLAASLMLLSFGLLLAGNIAAVGLLLEPIFHIHYQSAVILICLITLIYSLRGGIISDIYTDIFQIIIVVLSIGLTIGFVVAQYGWGIFAPTDVVDMISLGQLQAINQGALVNWATIIALGFGNILAIDFTARIFSARSEQAARRGCYVGAGLVLMLGLPFTVLALAIQSLPITPLEAEPIIMAFGRTVLPAWLYALLICGIINAALSTIDGAILSMGNILTHNFLQIQNDVANSNPVEAEKTKLYFARLSLLPITCLAMIFALVLPTPGVLLTVAFDIMFAALLVPFIASFIIKQPNAKAAWAAIIVGASSRFIFATLTPTSFGVSNGWFYIPNTIMPPEFDGLGTMLAPLLALVVYIFIHWQQRFSTSAAVTKTI